MSCTTIKAIWPGVKHEDLEELRNSHGSAPVIWGALCKRYLGGEFKWLTEYEKLFKLHERLDVPACLRVVLMMTYDRAYVLKKDYQKAAKDIKEFLSLAEVPSNYANHWPRIAEIFESDPDIPAIGFYCTSVSDDPFQGDWNEDEEKYDQVDWSTCWSVYGALPTKDGWRNE